MPDYPPELAFKHQMRTSGHTIIRVSVETVVNRKFKMLKQMVFNLPDVEMAMRSPNTIISAIQNLPMAERNTKSYLNRSHKVSEPID